MSGLNLPDNLVRQILLFSLSEEETDTERLTNISKVAQLLEDIFGSKI